MTVLKSQIRTEYNALINEIPICIDHQASYYKYGSKRRYEMTVAERSEAAKERYSAVGIDVEKAI